MNIAPTPSSPAAALSSSVADRSRPGGIYWIGGSKGGVGKSMMAMAMLEQLLAADHKPVLVECDTSNPDVWKTYREVVPTELLDLDVADGWIRLVNACDGCGGAPVVLNTAARNNLAVRRHAPTLDGALPELGRKLVALWMINRQRDSLELLGDFLEALPRAVVHVVRNGYFGEELQFELYNQSKVRELVESRGGQSLTLPDLADRVADDLYTKRLSIGAALKALPIGNRAELARWRAAVGALLAPIAQ